jgi:hypothetical protein
MVRARSFKEYFDNDLLSAHEACFFLGGFYGKGIYLLGIATETLQTAFLLTLTDTPADSETENVGFSYLKRI